MESRLEKYLKEKKEKKKKWRKYSIILVLIIFLFVAIGIVNDTLYSYFDLSDTSVFNYEYEKSTHTIELFGNEYGINLAKIIQNVKKQIVDIF